MNRTINRDWEPNFKWGYEVKGRAFRRMQEFPDSQMGQSKREIKRRERVKKASESYQLALREKDRGYR